MRKKHLKAANARLREENAYLREHRDLLGESLLATPHEPSTITPILRESHMKTAIDYAGLLGNYIRMERPATTWEKEHWEAENREPETVGGEGLVALVEDYYDNGLHRGVTIGFDYGISFTIKHSDEDWTISAWSPEHEQVRQALAQPYEPEQAQDGSTLLGEATEALQRALAQADGLFAHSPEDTDPSRVREFLKTLDQADEVLERLEDAVGLTNQEVHGAHQAWARAKQDAMTLGSGYVQIIRGVTPETSGSLSAFPVSPEKISIALDPPEQPQEPQREPMPRTPLQEALHMVGEPSRCPYLCTITEYRAGLLKRDDGFRCALGIGHVGGHVLYDTDGEKIIYQGPYWSLVQDLYPTDWRHPEHEDTPWASIHFD